MRELGIISVASMLDDRGHVTKGKSFLLDKVQLEIIKGASEYHEYLLETEQKHGDVPQDIEKYKNVILFGGSGTGKTLILAELLKMRIAHYERMEIPYRVIVAVCRPGSDQKTLLADLKRKYFSDLSGVEYSDEVDFVATLLGIVLIRFALGSRTPMGKAFDFLALVILGASQDSDGISDPRSSS